MKTTIQCLMKVVTIFLLSSLGAFAQGINFSGQPTTNNFRGGDLLLIDSVVSGGSGFSTRAATLSSVFNQFVVGSNYVTLSQLVSSNYNPTTSFVTNFRVANQVPTTQQAAHGFAGGIPSYVQGWLVQTNVAGDNGYPVGARVRLDNVFASSGGAQYCCLSVDSNNIYVVHTANLTPQVIPLSGPTNAYSNITTNNWNIRIEVRQ